MKPRFEIVNGDSLDVLATLPPGSVDAVVTDPPYGLNFMGKNWDKALPNPAIWAECLRVLKPGGHMVAFGAPRLYHRLACQIEDSGFEIRDCLMWLYGSGFPKSLNVATAIDKANGVPPRGAAFSVAGVGSQRSMTGTAGAHGASPGTTADAQRWAGFGTALKPAWEPIVLCRKPFKGTVANNVLAHGTGALNIDGCRIATDDNLNGGAYGKEPKDGGGIFAHLKNGSAGEFVQPVGRWPANLILDEEAGAILDGQSGIRQGGSPVRRSEPVHKSFALGAKGVADFPGYADKGGASRFFYCAKASRSEREAGLDGFEPGRVDPTRNPNAAAANSPRTGAGRQGERKNVHPTVKPLSLMRWLVRLITPPGGIVLDPFAGSGSTLCAAVLEGHEAIGIEMDPGHAAIARARTAHANNNMNGNEA